MLLKKDPKERPSIAQILQMPMVKKKMSEFVAAKGQNLKTSTKVFNKQVPTIVVKAPLIDPNETPKQRMHR